MSTSPSSNILVINCGSSSIKFAIIEPNSGSELITGLAEKLGSSDAQVRIKLSTEIPLASDKANDILLNVVEQSNQNKHDHKAAMEVLLSHLEKLDLLGNLAGVGHRLVHGGETYSGSILLDENILSEVEKLNHLAPLHNPVNLLGIKTSIELFPDLPQVAVFDTAFHQSIEPEQFLYGIPYKLYKELGARRYGFHGTSFRYVSSEAARRIKKPLEQSNFLIAHLGNGCSACAIRNGRSVDTTMGLTPLEGLVMGTRSGNVDPGLHGFLAKELKIDLQGVLDILNKQSGLLGLSELSNDMRELSEAASQGNSQAQLAIDVFCFRVARELGALAINLPSIDGLIFTGGIGENARPIREKIVNHMAILGFKIDNKLNSDNGNNLGQISAPDSTLAMVVQTNEELMIAKDTLALIAEQ